MKPRGTPPLRRLAVALRSLARHLFHVAPLPHATGSFSALVGALLADWCLELLAQGGRMAALGLALPASGWLGLALLCLADGWCRRIEYLRLKDIMARRGFDARVLSPVSTSRCQRDAALAAARELGHHGRAREHFRALGYRWWHLLPDACVDNPLRFFDPKFLRVTFLPGKTPADRASGAPATRL